MNKILIPSILIATILIAGIFAIVDVDRVMGAHLPVIGSAQITDNSITSADILDGTIFSTDISLAAEIAFSKLAPLGDSQILVGSSISKVAARTMLGDIAISNTGVTSIGTGVIVDADVNSAAAIAFDKLAALTSGNLLVGSSTNVATSVNPGGDVDISDTGVFSIQSEVIVNADLATNAIVFAQGDTITLGAPSAAIANTRDATYMVFATISTTGVTAGAATLTLSTSGTFTGTPAFAPAAAYSFTAEVAELTGATWTVTGIETATSLVFTSTAGGVIDADGKVVVHNIQVIALPT